MNKVVFEKLKSCADVDEVLELAKAHGKNITKEEATILFNQTHTEEGELSDIELDNVSGGAAGCDRNAYEVIHFKKKEDVYFIANVGDHVEAFVNENGVGNETYTGLVERRYITRNTDFNIYYDCYQVQDIKTGYSKQLTRASIEKK